MRLVLVRHGDAYAGFEGVIGGHRGCRGLTPLGRQQAELLGAYLAGTGRIHADVLLASRLPRAIETAEVIAPALDLRTVRQECDLCEVHPGEADGLTWADYAERFGTFDMEAEPERVFAPGGDSWMSFHQRVRRLIDRVAREFVDQSVVAVCHGGVIAASIRVLFGVGDPGAGARVRPVNTGLTEWEHEGSSGKWTLRSFNESAHLLDPGAAGHAPVA